MKHTWNQSKYSDHAMVTVMVDFETIDIGYGLLNSSLQLLDSRLRKIFQETHLITSEKLTDC